MLTYHPALDPFHSAFRCLQIMRFKGDQEFEKDRFRILEFYLAFPSAAGDMRLPRELVGWRKISKSFANHYCFSGKQLIVCKSTQPIHEEAVTLLFAKGLLDAEAFKKGRIAAGKDCLSEDAELLVA